MSTTIINPWQWQDKIGFVQGIKITKPQQWMICAGQTAMNELGEPQYADDILKQINLALDNLEIVLAGAGMLLKDVVRLSYYTTDLNAFHQASGSLKTRLENSQCYATATLLEVKSLAFPELMVEFEATAVLTEA